MLLATGAAVNGRDEAGATPLMHAAAIAPLPVMQALLRAGGDVNASDRRGATALMWATHDAARVRLLLDGGAAVNAARSDGLTPLVAATLRGRTDVVNVLLAAGADRNAGSVLAPWRMDLTRIATTSNDPAVLALAEARSLTPAHLAAWGPPPLSSWMITRTFAWRPMATQSGAPTIARLLDHGASANEMVSQLTLALPAVSRAAWSGDADAVKVLLTRGADPNRTRTGGLTPLMVAALADLEGTIVRTLLDAGATASTTDDTGRTGLDWALRLGDTPAAGLLRKAGATARTIAVAAPARVKPTRSPLAAVDLAIPRLQRAGPPLYEKTKCTSCHHQSLPAIAVARVRASGGRIDPALASHPSAATLEAWARSREDMLAGHCSLMGFLGNVTYGLLGLAEEHVAPNQVTDAVISCLGGLQHADGRWEGGGGRLPMEGSLPIVYTALAARGMQAFAPPGRRTEMRDRAARGLAFLRAAAPRDTQDDAFKLLGLVWGGAPRTELDSQRRRLLGLQRRDGGWGQLPTMPADAYATGQALYALQTADTPASAQAYRNGLQWLLSSQLADGTWHVRSRTIGFQPFVDTGFPHGPDQFISAAATSWAVIALSHGLGGQP
jgi:ankyrin repeat protein